MIAYEELVASLIEWRARQGLATGPTDYLGEPMPMPLVGPPQPEPDQGSADEYAELADSEILSEEPDEELAYGEIGEAEAYPGAEPVAFPDTDAVSMDEVGGAAYGEAQADDGGWDQQAPAEYGSYDDQPAADSWGESQPAVDAWGEPQPAADAWGEPQPDSGAQGVAAYDGEVTDFAPPPEHVEDQEYAEVMDEPGQGEVSAQTWDTEAEAEAVQPGEGGFAASGSLYEEDPYATADIPHPEEAGEPSSQTADEGDSTMDVDPDEILSADDYDESPIESGEIGGGDDPFGEPPPLAPPPDGDQPAGEVPQYDGAMGDVPGKPDPDQQ